MHYIRSGGGEEELYDWWADPWEAQDLARSSTAELARLRDSLAAGLAEAGAAHAEPGAAALAVPGTASPGPDPHSDD